MFPCMCVLAWAVISASWLVDWSHTQQCSEKEPRSHWRCSVMWLWNRARPWVSNPQTWHLEVWTSRSNMRYRSHSNRYFLFLQYTACMSLCTSTTTAITSPVSLQISCSEAGRTAKWKRGLYSTVIILWNQIAFYNISLKQKKTLVYYQFIELSQIW